MIITEQQRNELAEVCKPVMKWLNDNCHPHVTILVERDGAVLAEGIATIKTLEYIKD